MPIIEPIAPYHDRKSFDCGKRSMNDFLREKGLSQAYGSTWVVVPEAGAAEIIAYYSVSPDPFDLVTEYDDDIVATVIELERLAVDLKSQQQGIGRKLLVYLLKQTLQAADQYPIDALSLFALDDDAKAWYMSLDFGFRETTPGGRRLVLPIATMRQLFGGNQGQDAG